MQHILPQQIRLLIAEFSKLPGIGPKSAERLTFYLLKDTRADLDAFGDAVKNLRANIHTCPTCSNFTDRDAACVICTDPARDQSQICVVEEALDVVAIEKTKGFHGRYHVLGGTIAPLDGVGPQDLSIDALLTRIEADTQLQEVILATNPSLEGEATALYIIRKITRADLRVTRIARGLPVGGEVEYADEGTLSRAMEDRLAIKR